MLVSVEKLVEAGVLSGQDAPEIVSSRDQLFEIFEIADNNRSFTLPVCDFMNAFNYMIVFRHLVRLARMPFKYTRILSERDKNNPEVVMLTFRQDEQPIEWAFSHSSSWMSDEFKDLVKRHVDQHSDQTIYNLSREDEPYQRLISLPKMINIEGLTRF